MNLFYLYEENKSSLNNSFDKEDDIDILYLFSNIYENINIKGFGNSFALYKSVLKKLSKLCEKKTILQKFLLKKEKNLLKFLKI